MAISSASADENTARSKSQFAIKNAVAASFAELQSYITKKDLFKSINEQDSLEQNLRIVYDMVAHYVTESIYNKLSQQIDSMKSKDAENFTCELVNNLWKATERVVFSIYLSKNPNMSAYDILLQTNGSDKGINAPDIATRWILLLACFFGHFCTAECFQNIGICKAVCFFGILDRLIITANSSENKQLRLVCMELVRFTSMQIRPKSIPIDYELDETLTARIIERCRDKVAMVRVHSVSALGCLQGFSMMQDQIREELIRLTNTDPSGPVRMTALDALVMTKNVFELVRNRLRDTDDDVRQTMYRSLASTTILITEIPLKERLFILDQGLQDRNKRVIEACENVILKKWLPDCESDSITVLRMLDIELRPETAEKVAQLLVRNDIKKQCNSMSTESENASPGTTFLRSLQIDNATAITVEHAFYWRYECEYYSSKMQVNADGSNESVERREMLRKLLVPTILDYTVLLERLCQADRFDNMSTGKLDSSLRPFIVQQALHVGRFLDLHDEFGKKNLVDLQRKLLCDYRVDSTLIGGLVDLLSRITGSDSGDQFLRMLMEIVVDLCDQKNKQNQTNIESEESESLNKERAQAVSRFEELEKELEHVRVDSVEYNQIQSEMLVLENLLQDPCVLIWLRILEIIVQMLSIPGLNYHESTLIELKAIIVPAIESDVLAIREQAMLCIGLLALLDRDSASQHLGIFWHAIRNEMEDRDIKVICIKSIFDIMLCYPGLEPHYATNVNIIERDADSQSSNSGKVGPNSNASSLLLELAQYLYHDDSEVQELVVEGFAKLAVFGRVRMVGILAALLDVYFSKTTAPYNGHGATSRIPQILAVFFEQLGARAHIRSTTGSSECLLSFLEEAVGYWIRRWINQNGLKGSSLSDARQFSSVDPTTLIRFAMHHLDHTGKLDPGQKECAHQNRIGINVTIDIMALYNVMSQDTRPTQVLKQVNASLKELYRCLAVSGGCCNEKRSAVLFCGLLREVIEHSTDEAASAPPLSRILDLERALSESLGCTDELFDTDVHKMDLVWAHEQILERTQQLNDQLDKFDSSNSKKSKKRSNRRTTISSEENSDVSMECTSDSDCDSTEDVSLSQKRTVSMRKCKDIANSRIQFNSGDSIQDSDGSLLECLDPDQSSDDEDASKTTRFNK